MINIKLFLSSIYRYSRVFGDGVAVRQEELSINFNTDSVYTCNYEDYCHAPNVVLTRARACLGQRGYNALRNDNDDFCRWCKSGKHTYQFITDNYPGAERGEDGTHYVNVTILDAIINEGDHISWQLLYHDTPDNQPQWKHGIVLDVGQNSLDVISFSDNNNAINIVPLSCLDFKDYMVRRYIYERCHVPDDVTARATSRIGTLIVPDECNKFCRWCKLGIPCDSDTTDELHSGAAGAGVAGGAAGAAIGTFFFPGVGTIVGGIIGVVVGGIAGQIGGRFAGAGIASLAKRPYDNLFVDDDLM